MRFQRHVERMPATNAMKEEHYGFTCFLCFPYFSDQLIAGMSVHAKAAEVVQVGFTWWK